MTTTRVERNSIAFGISYDREHGFTIVTAVGHRFSGIGAAKCSPDDVWDDWTGADIAMARALRDLADTTETNAGMRP